MARDPVRAADRSGRLPATSRAALLDAALLFRWRWPRIVLRVEPTHLPAAVALAPLAIQERPAARAATLFREQRFERGNGVDLTSAGPAGEPGHGLIVALDGCRAIRSPEAVNQDYVGWRMSSRLRAPDDSRVRLRAMIGHPGRWPISGPLRSPPKRPAPDPQTFGRLSSASATRSAGYSKSSRVPSR